MSENPPGATGLLSDVPDDKSFRLEDGRSIHSLSELYQTLQGLDEAVFEHHVSKEKNDFSNWVKDIHKDYRLANSLFSAETREDCARAVGTRIYEIQKSKDKKKENVIIPAPKPAAPAPIVKKVDPAPAPKPAAPSVQRPAAKSDGFSREEQIAKAILQQKPISPELLSPRKKKKAVEQPKQVVSTDKKSMETASERLEKILAEAARSKMEEARKKKEQKGSKKLEEFRVANPEPVIKPEEPVLPREKEPEQASDNALFEFPEQDESTAEVIKLVESKSFASQLKSDMKTVLSPSSLGSLAKDMKSLVPSKKAKDETIEPESKGPASPCKSKDMMISHLKKVYK